MIITTLQTNPTDDYEKNLEEIIRLYQESEADFVLAPEVCLTDFDYCNFKRVGKFAKKADKILREVIKEKPLALTVIEKRKGKFFNNFRVYQNGEIIYSQDKHKLFLLGEEDKYFSPGKSNKIKKFTIGDVVFGTLICFELRFTELWKVVEGVDVILIPAAWGKLRKDHFETLTKALAIVNRCFVVVADLGGEKYAKGSGVISPFGEVFRDDRKLSLTTPIDLKEIKKMKKFIPYK